MKDGEIPSKLTDFKVNSEGVAAQKGLTGKYYCGRKILSCSCCNGHCGPNNGCNCLSCQKLDQEERELREEEERHPATASAMIIDSWTWGQQPTTEHLREALQALILEQQELACQAAGTTLSAMRLKQRLAVLSRYFIAQARHRKHGEIQSRKLKERSIEQESETNKLKAK